MARSEVHLGEGRNLRTMRGTSTSIINTPLLACPDWALSEVSARILLSPHMLQRLRPWLILRRTYRTFVAWREQEEAARMDSLRRSITQARVCPKEQTLPLRAPILPTIREW